MQETVASIAVLVLFGIILGYLLAFTRHFNNELKKDSSLGKDLTN